MTLTVGSLFSGIGGLDLGLEQAGMKTIWQVEFDDWARGKLEENFPHTEKFKDVREVGKHNLRPVDLIAGGFPCTDISIGKENRAGLSGPSSGLWFEFNRLICELRPNTHSLRTSQTCLFSTDTELCLTLPEAGLMRNGRLYPERPLVHLMNVRGYSSLPTPNHRDYRDVSMKEAYASNRERHQPSLATEVLLSGAGGLRIGQIYEWVMGFPYRFLESTPEPTGTPSSLPSQNGSEKESSSLIEDKTMNEQQIFHFGGDTFDASKDGVRLSNHLAKVKEFMSDHKWHSLREIADNVGCTEASGSARLRDLRKPFCGSLTVERKRMEKGLWMYRLA